MWLVLAVAVALAADLSNLKPSAPQPVPAPAPVLTMEFLRRIPTGPPPGTSSLERLVYPVCEEAICPGLFRETWRRVPGNAESALLRDDVAAARRRRLGEHWRQDPLAVLPTGHSLEGFVGLIAGADPRDPGHIAGGVTTVILDGAVLMDRTSGFGPWSGASR